MLNMQPPKNKLNKIAQPLPTYRSIFQEEAIVIWQVGEIIKNKNLSNINIKILLRLTIGHKVITKKNH